MRISIFIFLFLIGLVTSQDDRFQSVGGDYAKVWLQQNIAQENAPEPKSLWDWGGTPKGKTLQNGELVDENNTARINKTFAWLGSTLPVSDALILNSTGLTSLNGTPISPSKALSDDPWILAQQLERPILANMVDYPPLGDQTSAKK